MKTIVKILLVSFLFVSCSAIKNGYTEGYRRKELQKAIVITKCEKWLNRYKYEAESIPSGLIFHFSEFDTIARVGDTLQIDRALSDILFISR